VLIFRIPHSEGILIILCKALAEFFFFIFFLVVHQRMMGENEKKKAVAFWKTNVCSSGHFLDETKCPTICGWQIPLHNVPFRCTKTNYASALHNHKQITMGPRLTPLFHTRNLSNRVYSHFFQEEEYLFF
jgi:hypothetical protein